MKVNIKTYYITYNILRNFNLKIHNTSKFYIK